MISIENERKRKCGGNNDPAEVIELIQDNQDTSNYYENRQQCTTTTAGADNTPLNPWTRRNSISLPAALDTIMSTSEPPEYDPQLTPEHIRTNGYDTSDTFSEICTSDDDSCHIGVSRTPRIPPRNARRKSVMPLNRRLMNDLYDKGGSSHDNSVTSINSIASLLREKLMMTLPTGGKGSRTSSEFKLRLFVSFLFLLILSTISFSHVFYHQYVLQREYFPYTRFNKEERYIKLVDKMGQEIALGHLGVDLPETDRVYECRRSDRVNGSQCFEWMDHARVRLTYENRSTLNNDLHCYNIRWYSLSDTISPMDCYEDGYQYGHWYGGGRTLGMAWPVELGRVEMSPFVTGHIGRHRWGRVLKRYFINSKGVAITVDGQSPLYVSINAGHENRLCLKGHNDNFMYITSTGRPTLNYTICTSSNMKTLHLALAEKSLWDGLKMSDTEIVNSLLTEPVWQIPPRDKNLLTDSIVVNYTEDVIALGFLRQGHVLLNEFWQTHIGDFKYDLSRFPPIEEKEEEMVDTIHRRGFKIILTIQPFISTESENFAEAVRKDLLVNERGNDENRRIPALTRYKSLRSAGMLDITNNDTRSWLQQQLKRLLAEKRMDGLYLDLGSAYDLPRHYEFKKNLTNPDHYKALFIECVSAVVPVLGVSSAITRPPAPIFLSLPSLQSSWESLQVTIPTTLTYGIVGYPFLMPGPVAGDYVNPQTYNDNDNETIAIFEEMESNGTLPDQELYVRWLQLATFLPVIRYSHLPSKYGEHVIELAKGLTALRHKIVNPLLTRYVQEALDYGIPLIRPLWMLDPSDTICHLVKDEFSVGEELIVAPILRANSVEREVYLPAGVWKDGIDGSLRKGSRWIHNYKVPLSQIAYFIKMPDNTRL